MKAKLIKTEEEYILALARMEELFDVTPESEDFDEAELLITLIELYENEHYKIEAPDPIDAIKFRIVFASSSRFLITVLRSFPPRLVLLSSA